MKRKGKGENKGIRHAVIYIRVSTKRQAEEGVSLDAQLERCREWCEFKGYQVEGEYIERGISGRKLDNRPMLAQALSAMGDGGVFVVYALSRAARSAVDAGSILNRINAVGGNFASVTEDMDTTSATGKLLFNLMAAIAQFESEMISERTQAAFEQCRSTGRSHCANPIFGYDHRAIPNGDHKKYKLVKNKSEQKVIANIKRWRSDGDSLRTIASRLNDERIPTKRGGKVWYASTVRSVLENQLHNEG